MKEQFKKQHIVPQAYLKRFASEINGKYIIGTRLSNKDNKVKLFSSPVKDVAYINNYYDTTAKGDNKFWEHYLNENFDTLYGQKLDDIISTITLSASNACVINENSRLILSQIIMSQSIRVPAYLDEQIENAAKLIDYYKTNIIKTNPDLSTSKLDIIKNVSIDTDKRKNIVLSVLSNKERFNYYCNILAQKVWVAYYNAKRDIIPFITSDNPVLYANINGEASKLLNLGISNDKMVIYFPISPSILIGIYSPDAYFGAIKKHDGKRIFLDEEKFIIDINKTLISQSKTHSFLPEPLFSLALDKGTYFT